MGITMNALQSPRNLLHLHLHLLSSTKTKPLSPSSKFPINPFLPNPTQNYSNTLLLKPIQSSFSSSSSTSSSGSPTNKEQKWVHEGTISESLPNGMFWVNCDNGDVILGYVSGKMRRGSIRILPGDRVKIEVSRYDSTRGRIIYRTRG